MSTIEKAMEKLSDSPKTRKELPPSEDPIAPAKEPTTLCSSTRTGSLGEKISPEKENSVASGVVQPEMSQTVPEFSGEDRTLFIDKSRLAELGMICGASDLSDRRIVDEFRAIKHKLINNAFGSGAAVHTNGNLIMVSSANPNEGKTFNAINLALSIASEKNKTVLLVDADVLNPSVGEMLELEQKPGLIDYLFGDVDDVSDIIYPTSIPDLRIMPAGMSHHMSYELLSSDKMLALTKDLASRYSDRIILLDCPPLLGVVETVTLSNLIGQAVVVVEQNKTKIADINQAVSLLNTDMAIGFIINKSTHKSGVGYGYGYGYGYGSKAKKR